jgi:ABC-2 type transport system permease protein
MMAHIFSFEWLHIRKSGAFWGTVIVLPILIGFSLFLGSERINQQKETIAGILAEETSFYDGMRSQLEAIERGEVEVDSWFQNPANPLVLGQFGQAGRHIFLQPKPLAPLAAGQLDILPYYGKVTLTTMEPLRDNTLENPLMQVSGSFDFAFVLVWLVPLFIIVMGYNMISSERERGTYSLLQSQPVSIRSILIQKMIFRFLLVFGIIILSLLVWSVLFGIDLFNIQGLQLIGVISFYAAFWFALCALFNQFRASSAVNAVGLTGLWVIFLLIIPSIISLIVTSLHPVPSRALWITEQRTIQQAVEAEGDDLFDLWVVDHPEEFVEGDTPQFYNTWMRRFVWAQTIAEREQEAERQFEAPRERQAQLASRMRVFSPPMTLQAWLERKAGTDTDRLRSLEFEMRSFQQEWQEFFCRVFKGWSFLHLMS